MSSSSFALGSVLDGVPSHVSEVSDVGCARGLEHHQHPLVHGIHDDGQFALGLLDDGLSHPRRWPFLFALVHDGSERRVDVVSLSPFARQTVEASRHGIRARVEVERPELGVEFRIQSVRREPVVFPILAVADVEFVRARVQLAPVA